MFATVLLAIVASNPAPPTDNGKIELVSGVVSVRAGEPFQVGIRLLPASGWHTYWMNPGDSGSPTSVEWHLPKGWTTGPIQWPAPDRIDIAGVVCYGYDRPTILLQTLTPPPALVTKSIDLAGRVKWMTCTPEMCKPANGEFQLKLPITSGTPVQDPVWHVKLAEAASRIPRPLVAKTAEARIVGHEIVLSVSTEGPLIDKPGKPYFFPASPGMVSHSMPQSYSFSATGMVAHLPISEYSNKTPTRLSGVLKAPSGEEFAGQGSAVTINVPIITSQEKNHE